MLAIAWCACGGTSRRIDPIATTSTRAPLEVGKVVAVEEIGDTTIVFDHTHAFTLRGGVLAAAVEHTWFGGAVVPAPDGDGRWATGIDDEGKVWRITIAGELEDVTDRFGLGGSRVTAVGSAGPTTAFALGKSSHGFTEVAVSNDGVHMTRVDAAGYAIAVGRGRIAVASEHNVAVWDLASATARDYPIASARAIAFFDQRDTTQPPRLAIATSTVLWLESGGSLHRIAPPVPIYSLVSSGSRLWLLADAPEAPLRNPAGRLYALEGETLRPIALKSAIAADIFGSPNGDIWVSSSGAVIRTSVDSTIGDPTWQAQIAPVFARVCAHCHRPGGEADIDLSTPASWHAEHDEIRKRVIETRTMPPSGTELSDADRAAIATWLGGH